MAEIGTQLIEGQAEPVNVGSAIEQGGMQIPDDEVSRSPQFAKNLEWLKKPENLMTALVFLGAAVQPKREGLNTAQHVARAGVGALGFNSAYRASQRDEQRTIQEQTRRDQMARDEAQNRREQIGLGKEQIAATRENTAADLAVGREQIQAQRWVAEQSNEMRMQLARMERDTALKIAEMESSLKSAGMNALFGPDDMKAINDMVATSQDGPTPMTHQDALQKYMRLKILSNPQYLPLLQFFEPQATPAPPAPPTEGGKPKAKPQSRPGYYQQPTQIPAFGLPDYRTGQSKGPGPHEAPPQRNPNLYPGTK